MTVCYRLLLLKISFISVFAYSAETINWQVYDRPPGFITSGPNQGQGFVQQVLTLITAELPHYRHQMTNTTLARSLADIKTKHNICHPALINTAQRRKHMYFSQPAIVNPTHRIIASSDKITPFIDDNEVNLVKLIQSNRLTLAHLNGRSYGQTIDQLLAKPLSTNNIFKVQQFNSNRVFKMIEKGRVDFTISYPHELYQYKNIGINEEKKLTIYKIKDIPAYTSSAIACSKNSWGQKVIKDINRVLNKIKPTKAYQNAMLQWRQQEANTAEFQHYYQHSFLSNYNHPFYY